MTKQRITPLTLGTVQLGMDYGIANGLGKPDKTVGYEILTKAADLGVTTWDTSRHYGDSEEIIGSFLRGNNISPYIISKFKWSEEALCNQNIAIKEALQHVNTSLRMLGRNSLSLLLYHTDSNQDINEVMKMLPTALKLLRKEGLIEEGGISLYYPEDTQQIIDEEEITAVQIPMNVFDQRLLTSNMMQNIMDAEKTVFARSIFLQGLFFLPEDRLPFSIKKASAHIRTLHELAEKAEMSVAQFAFSFIRDIKGVNSIVFGADNAEQVVQNVQMLGGEKIPADIREQTQSLFQNIDKRIITPGMWKS